VGAAITAAGAVQVIPVRGVPEVRPGDDLAALLLPAVQRDTGGLLPYDVVVVTHKVVSKAERAMVDLASVEPGDQALALAAAGHNDPRVVEVVLRQSRRVVRAEAAVLVCETHHGLVCANAGVDRSNAGGGDWVTVLPADPDASARRLRDAWRVPAGGGPLAVVISDTFGRPFRLAGVNVAIGVAGMPAISDHTGESDAAGYTLRGSEIATADEIASAAELVMGKLEGVPVAVVRGLRWVGEGDGAAPMLRDPAADIFRR
jgi:coenzyme F420-0:L-glutamate ligase/coenzyme F420-1:gamma-L-glutamate ligase